MENFQLPSKIQLIVVTPERSLVGATVDEVTLPGDEGYLGVLPGHTPLLTSLKIGEIKYRMGNTTKYLFVSWGFAEILPDRVTVLADVAETPEDIDLARATEERDEAEKRLKHLDDDFRAAQIELEQALCRMQVAAKAAPLPR